MSSPHGRGRAVLVADGTVLDEQDAALLRAIDRTESIAAAASDLGRSRARALRRIDTLEAAFGTLVSRQRGGTDGGGSTLTTNGEAVLHRYDRLAAALTATAQVPETVLTGEITHVDGELAAVCTALGEVYGLRDTQPPDTRVQVRIGADAVTLYPVGQAPSAQATSARNRCQGTVDRIDSGETIVELTVAVDNHAVAALITERSLETLDLAVGDPVVLTWKASATRLITLEQ